MPVTGIAFTTNQYTRLCLAGSYRPGGFDRCLLIPGCGDTREPESVNRRNHTHVFTRDSPR